MDGIKQLQKIWLWLIVYSAFVLLYLFLTIIKTGQFSSVMLGLSLAILPLAFILLPAGFFIFISSNPGSIVGSGDPGRSDFFGGPDLLPAVLSGWAIIVFLVFLIHRAKSKLQIGVLSAILLLFLTASLVGCLAARL
jgi:hypothetical protein